MNFRSVALIFAAASCASAQLARLNRYEVHKTLNAKDDSTTDTPHFFSFENERSGGWPVEFNPANYKWSFIDKQGGEKVGYNVQGNVIAATSTVSASLPKLLPNRQYLVTSRYEATDSECAGSAVYGEFLLLGKILPPKQNANSTSPCVRFSFPYDAMSEWTKATCFTDFTCNIQFFDNNKCTERDWRNWPNNRWRRPLNTCELDTDFAVYRKYFIATTNGNGQVTTLLDRTGKPTLNVNDVFRNRATLRTTLNQFSQRAGDGCPSVMVLSTGFTSRTEKMSTPTFNETWVDRKPYAQWQGYVRDLRVKTFVNEHVPTLKTALPGCGNYYVLTQYAGNGFNSDRLTPGQDPSCHDATMRLVVALKQDYFDTQTVTNDYLEKMMNEDPAKRPQEKRKCFYNPTLDVSFWYYSVASKAGRTLVMENFSGDGCKDWPYKLEFPFKGLSKRRQDNPFVLDTCMEDNGGYGNSVELLSFAAAKKTAEGQSDVSMAMP